MAGPLSKDIWNYDRPSSLSANAYLEPATLPGQSFSLAYWKVADKLFLLGTSKRGAYKVNPLKLAPRYPMHKRQSGDILETHPPIPPLSLSIRSSLTGVPAASSFIRGAYLHASLQSRFHEITARPSRITSKWCSSEGGREEEGYGQRRPIEIAGAAHRLLLFLRMNDQNDRFEAVAKVNFLFLPLVKETFVSSIMIERRVEGDGNVKNWKKIIIIRICK